MAPRYGSSRPAWSLLPSSRRKGSARVSRAGERVFEVANFSWRIAEDQIPRNERLFRRDAETNTRDACATHSQILPLAGRSKRGFDHHRHCRCAQRRATNFGLASPARGKLLVRRGKGGFSFATPLFAQWCAPVS